MNGHFEADEKMTVQICLKICRSKSYIYAGLQWQYECYCGNEPKQGFEWAWPEKCNDRCAGDNSQVCGGTNAISIWNVPPLNLDGVCIFNSPINQNLMNEYSITGHQNLTIENCQQICSG